MYDDIIASEAERSEVNSQSEDSLRESERAPVPVYGKTKQLNISKTKHIWNMVHITKNTCFHPLNPFPRWTGPTRPGPARPWRSLNAYISGNIKLSKKWLSLFWFRDVSYQRRFVQIRFVQKKTFRTNFFFVRMAPRRFVQIVRNVFFGTKRLLIIVRNRPRFVRNVF